jgi:hypothetical protein
MEKVQLRARERSRRTRKLLEVVIALPQIR